MDLFERAQDWLFSALVLPVYSEDQDDADEVFSESAHSERRETVTTVDTYSAVEEVHAFTVKNLSTGEVLDLRDENKPEFPQRYAHLLSMHDAEHLENYLCEIASEQKRLRNIALWEAAQANDALRCRTLLDSSRQGSLAAQPNSKGLNDWTVLHIVADQGATEVCAVLLDPAYGVDVNARTAAGRTPLHLAALRGHVKVGMLLLECGALLNAQDSEGNTPLHLAAMNDNAAMMQWLCAQRPDASLANRAGLSALDLADSPGVQEVLEECFRIQGITYKKPEHKQVRFAEALSHSSRSDLMSMQMTQDARQDLSAPQDLLPVSILGRGMFGVVYLARQLSTFKEFAVKVVQKSDIDKHGLEPYLQTERRVLASMQHPFIVRLETAFQTADTVVMVLNYARGGDLTNYLQREKVLSEQTVRFYGAEVLLALEALHQRSILYRDLKPGNVMIDHEGHAVLIDFGLAKEHMSSDKLTWSFCGSPAYLPPETIRKAGTSLRADWYQFGVLLYEMLVGAPPFYCHSRELMLANITKAKLSIPKHVSAEARDLIVRLLERDPDNRLADANAVKQHPFFTGVDWADVERKAVAPPSPRLIRPRSKAISREKIYGRPVAASRLLEDWPVLLVL